MDHHTHTVSLHLSLSLSALSCVFFCRMSIDCHPNFNNTLDINIVWILNQKWDFERILHSKHQQQKKKLSRNEEYRSTKHTHTHTKYPRRTHTQLYAES